VPPKFLQTPSGRKPDLVSTDDGQKGDRNRAALPQVQEASEEELSPLEEVEEREKRVQQARDRLRRAEPACVARPERYGAGLVGGDVVKPPLARSLATAHCKSHDAKRAWD
jgi:hypothetical protein